MQVESLGWEDPLEEGLVAHFVFLPGESRGQRGLVGYSPQDHKKLDMHISHFRGVLETSHQKLLHDYSAQKI